MNRPERYETYVLEPDQVKIEYTKDMKKINAGEFKILKEDHTLGNLLRMQLLHDKRVFFAGYKVPHPLTNEILVKIRTNGKMTPKQALLDSIDALLVINDKVKKDFDKQIKMKQQNNQFGSF